MAAESSNKELAVKLLTSPAFLFISFISICGIGYVLYKWLTKAKFDKVENVNDDAAPKDNSNPNSVGGNGKALTSAEKAAAAKLADRLYKDMDGVTLLMHDNSAFEELTNSSDRMLIATYNAFGEKYYTEEDGTLAQWIADESGFWMTGTDWETMQDLLINRFSKLNLK